ncbi:MAG: maltokinase N-terminal cap-like domain-containing protein [Pseudonocardia sp.]
MTFADELAHQLPEWLARQRWFAAKGRPVRSAAVAVHGPLRAEGEPLLDLVLLDVEFDDGSPAHRYQVLLGRRAEIGPELETAAIGRVGGMVAYDGLWDHAVTAWLLDAVRTGAEISGVRFVAEPGAEIAHGVPGRVVGVEQSNTSVVYGERSILKLFRRVAPGANPDVELHRALRAAGSTQVAALQGAIEGTFDGTPDGEPATFAMVQDFAANSADGWAMALASVRDLLAEGDLHADEVGGDFAAESHRLGETVAVVHAELARVLGTAERDPGELADVMAQRLDAAAAAVPSLGDHVDAVRASYDALAALGAPIPAQRVHGDLHLGQTLRTPYGWLVIDFEGEPSAPLAERVRPDSALRDVAGMLRSFDYAAFHQLQQWEPGVPIGTADSQATWHAHEWATRNRDAFCDGYTAGAGSDPRTHATVLRAFELDKAVYEVVYETRSRPSWVPIPLASIARITAQARSDAGVG